MRIYKNLIRFLMSMKKSEINFIGKILLGIFGITNIIPSRYSIYDEYLIPFIESNLDTSNVFFLGIKLGIFIFKLLRIIILVLTILLFYDAFKYGVRYNVFGLRDIFYERR